ncbi:MAG TPA: Calx-beta domain-containing protein, partial [Methylomirabilota bacterium]|nr:Calx-beta domain-containing protein [Methylomirabilota bacterium]
MQNTQQFNFRLSRTLMALVVISGVALASQAQQFRLTGELRDGVDSQAFAVAANGAVLAGRAEDADFTLRAVRWTPAGGLKALNLPGSTESEAQAISNDGNVIVGGFRDAQERQRAFRWTETGVTDLGTLTSPGAAFATGVSGDGNVVVGWSLNEQGQEQPFRWSAATGMENLGTLGGIRGFAYDANADGAVVVGAARDTSETLRAFRWSRAKGKELVPVSAQGFSEARAITGDGRFIAGNDSAGAFRWNETGSVTRIAPPPRNDSFTAWDISSDGSRLVGLADNEEFSTVASVWTEQTGSVDLNKAFAGVIAGGWTLVEATAISPDGNWIVGIAERGFDRQGFILHAAQIPVPSPEFYFPSMAKSAQETDRSVRLVVSHTNPMPGTYTVHFQTVGGSASAGSDFMATNGVLTFAPGETSKEISITLLNDGQREGDESFQLQLSNASPGMTVASGTATVFIGDNDFGYEAPFFYQVSEADPFIDVTVRRIGDFNMETTLDLIARAEDAVPGVDFVASTNRLVFAPGAQRATARIQLLNDAIRDGSKTLIVVFTNATGGLPAPQTHVMINILDNEEGYTLGDGAHVIEGPGSTLNVYRIGEYSSPAQVRITVTNENFGEPGTATVNQDFTQFVTTVTFAPGQTNATVSIPIKDDHEMERDETFYVLLESLSPSVSAPEHAAVVRLRDNDINPAQVSSVNFTGHLSEILQVSTMADGRFLITGRLDVSIEGFQEFDQVLRLLPDGSVDPTFTPYTTKARLGSMTQAPNGQILVVEHPGLRETRVIRLHENGGVDTFFNPPTSLGSSVIIVAHPNGGVLLSGEGRLIRLLQNGQVDPAFS